MQNVQFYNKKKHFLIRPRIFFLFWGRHKCNIDLGENLTYKELNKGNFKKGNSV